MSQSYDAIVIGAGIIGACTAFELAKRGWRTLNVDKLPAAGYGSTGSSCAIIRTHYSTLDGSALAYEAFFDWDDWASYLDVRRRARSRRVPQDRLPGHEDRRERPPAVRVRPSGCARHPLGGLGARADRGALPVLRPARVRPAQAAG